MKKPITALLTAALLLTTAACSAGGSDIDQPVQGTSASAGVTDGSATIPAVQAGEPAAEEDPAEEPAEEPDETEPVGELEEQILVDEEDIRITATGLEDTWMGPALKVLIENNSDTDLTFQTRATSVNGYMIDTMFSPDVAAGKKANDEITLSASEMEAAGIDQIADIETIFHVFTTEDWEAYHDTDPVSIRTSIAEDHEYSFDDSGEVLYDDKDIRIIAKGISKDDSWFGPGLVVFIENLSDVSITVQARDVSANGFMVDTIFSPDIAPGKRVLDAVTFMETDLETNSIEEITEVELGFHIFETDEWETIVDTEKYSLEF